MQIIKQPNGEFAVWSEAAQDFIRTDADRWDIINMLVEEEENRIKVMVDEVIEQLRKKKKPYGKRTLTWAEAKKAFKKAHGRSFKK